MRNNAILWTPAMLVRFKAAYKIEEPGGPQHVFRFDGHDYVVSYAKYLIEYLDSVLPPR